ncbi:MAG: hypothetical protein MI863_16690 [Desulfobacterales bacterium]|nr:hypothetical protein [Desulfobacterales bacterium]
MRRNRQRYSPKSRQKALVLIGIGVVVCIAVLAFLTSRDDRVSPTGKAGDANVQQQDKSGSQDTADPEAGDQPLVVTGEINTPTTIDYKDLEKDEDLKTMMGDRKKSLGIKESLDMIVKSDESFTVGESTVSMQKILEKAFTKEGKVFQEELSESGSAKPTKIREYGIYVVQPGDNLWNIHFRILRDYYAAKGISVEEKADEPGASGMSSGVGKILKFSETMVIIYNLIEEKVTQDINIIEPLSKVIVYNMDAVFSLLEEINFDNVDRLQFDGKNIWIPAKKS